MRTAPGAPHPWPEAWRHVTKPLPYLAAITKPPFFKPGTRTMQWLLFSKSCGMDLSGVLMISLNSAAASFRRSFVFVSSAAHIAPHTMEHRPATDIASASLRKRHCKQHHRRKPVPPGLPNGHAQRKKERVVVHISGLLTSRRDDFVEPYFQRAQPDQGGGWS